MVHLAQYNIARARAPLSDPLLAGFVAEIARLNAIAEQSPGFVWRLKDENGASSSYVRAYEDERMLINFSVWESIEALKAYTYGDAHLALFRRRAEWFEPHDGPSLVMWWIPAGHIPPVAEAVERLAHLTANGPTPYAFNFKQSF
jgi:hypothetical protein